MCNYLPQNIKIYVTGIRYITKAINVIKIIAKQLKNGTVKLNRLKKKGKF